MTDEPREPLTPRERLARAVFQVPASRLRTGAQSSPATEATRPTSTAANKPAARTEYLSIKAELHQRLLDEIDDIELTGETDANVATAVRGFVDRVLDEEELPLNDAERRSLAEDLLQETMGVGPLATLMADPAVTDILVNRFDAVYVERYGQIEKTDIRFRDNEHLVRIIQRIAARVGRRVDDASPMVDARLPDGSRVNATIQPITLDGPTLSIRRFGHHRLRREELLRLRMFTPEMVQFLELAVRGRRNVLISGGTGSGKTTFLGAVAEAIPPNERIITIEDAAELLLPQEHVIRMETRPANVEGRGRIAARDLVINALRMRPDRIIVGEVRGAEALDMLQAMNTGHDGSLTTVHANTPRDALSRIETMVLMAGTDLPSRAIREQMVSAIHLIVQIRRYEDGVRRVESVAEVTGLEGLTPQMQDIFKFERQGRKGRVVDGAFVATGVVPRMVDDLRDRGLPVDLKIFSKPQQPS